MDSDGTNTSTTFTLDSIRDTLVRQEDTIIFSLIERAKFPLNWKAYHAKDVHGFASTILDFVVRDSESLQAKVGRYENPEELPFFPEDLQQPLVPPYNFPQILYPAAASVNVSKTIWDVYVNQLLQLIAAEGDDGNYASAAACDLVCLQALSRRIHYGRFVAEVKFRGAPSDYEPLIRAKDKDALMTLLTDTNVEEMVKERVKKKAMIFGQNVTLNDTASDGNYKVDPMVVYRLYDEWVIPLTKDVEVEYLLRRLD
ncbi:chorismate mutase [Ancistrocladus abbreviatus]